MLMLLVLSLIPFSYCREQSLFPHMDSAVCQSFHDKCWLHHFGWFGFEGKWGQHLCFFNCVETLLCLILGHFYVFNSELRN